MWCSNIVSRGIFCCRRVGKISKDTNPMAMAADATVGSGQGIGFLQEISNYEGKIATCSTGILNNIRNMANYGQGLGAKAAKGALWASKHVNPLISLATGIKILTSDDKEKALYTDGMALGAMFLGENWAKKFLGSTCAKTLFSGILKSLSIANPAGMTILSGLAFVGASIGAWKIGSKLGKILYKDMHPFLKNTKNDCYCFKTNSQNMFKLTGNNKFWS